MPKTWLLRSKPHFRDLRKPVSILRQKPQPPIKAHRHEFVEIVLVMGGTAVHRTGVLKHKIVTGDVLVIHGKRSHAYEETQSLHLINILIQKQVLDEAAKHLGGLTGYHPLFTFEFARGRSGDFSGRLRLSPSDLKKAAAWADVIEEQTAPANESGYYLAKSCLMLLIGLLANSYGKAAAMSPQLHMRLGRVLGNIDRDPSKNHPLKELAVEAAMSERSFLRYFKKATGFSPADYIIRSRIHRAEEMLLREGDSLAITEIAFKCGFNDSNYFSRQFRRVTGKTPRNYRQTGSV